MRIVKTKLQVMVPGLRIFLDIDDLREGKGAEYVDRSRAVLILVSEGYFVSRNCLRELLRALVKDKPIITLISDDKLTVYEVKGQLEKQAAHNWHGLAEEVCKRGGWIPTADEVFSRLFDLERPMEWSRQQYRVKNAR